jgi:hypothetical protein
MRTTLRCVLVNWVMGMRGEWHWLTIVYSDGLWYCGVEPSDFAIRKLNAKVKLSLCFKWAQRNEGVLGNGGIAPRILDLGTRGRWMVSFTPRPLYPQGKSPWYPLYRRLGGPQSRTRRGDEEKKFPTPAGTRTPYLPARSPVLYHWAILAPTREVVLLLFLLLLILLLLN